MALYNRIIHYPISHNELSCFLAQVNQTLIPEETYILIWEVSLHSIHKYFNWDIRKAIDQNLDLLVISIRLSLVIKGNVKGFIGQWLWVFVMCSMTSKDGTWICDSENRVYTTGCGKQGLGVGILNIGSNKRNWIWIDSGPQHLSMTALLHSHLELNMKGKIICKDTKVSDFIV